MEEQQGSGERMACSSAPLATSCLFQLVECWRQGKTQLVAQCLLLMGGHG